VAVSGIGSLAHYAAITVMKRLGNEKVAYISTNTTPNSYTALLGKATDAAILTPPYTSMATLAGYSDLGNTFDVRDLQGGLVTRSSHLHDHREQVKSMIRATLRSMDINMRNEAAVLSPSTKRFRLGAKNSRGHLQDPQTSGQFRWRHRGSDPVFKSIIDKIRQESGITAEIPADRLVDLSP